MKFFIMLLLISMISGCTERPDIDELSQIFTTHRSSFNQLADTGCQLKSMLNTKFHHYKIDTASEYPEHLAEHVLKINTLLHNIDAKSLVIHQDGQPECSLYIRQWSYGFAGDGSYMGFSYQPAALAEYRPAIHLRENRNFREKMHFTKPLADGWYIEYVNQP